MFDNQTREGIKKNANAYSEKEFQDNEVPLHDFVQLTGEITMSEKKSSAMIEKGTRFVIQSGDSQYQIFNEQTLPLKVGETVTVYGEYYGFIKAILIEKEK